MGRSFPTTADANRVGRSSKPRLARAVVQYNAVSTLTDSVKLESAPYRTEIGAYEALANQSKQPGFVIGFVDSESKVVTSFFQRFPEPANEPLRKS